MFPNVSAWFTSLNHVHGLRSHQDSHLSFPLNMVTSNVRLMLQRIRLFATAAFLTECDYQWTHRPGRQTLCRRYTLEITYMLKDEYESREVSYWRDCPRFDLVLKSQTMSSLTAILYEERVLKKWQNKWNMHLFHIIQTEAKLCCSMPDSIRPEI